MPKSDINSELARKIYDLLLVEQAKVDANDPTVFTGTVLHVHPHGRGETHVDVEFDGVTYRLDVNGPFPE